jgi:hypothetical protein
MSGRAVGTFNRLLIITRAYYMCLRSDRNVTRGHHFLRISAALARHHVAAQISRMQTEKHNKFHGAKMTKKTTNPSKQNTPHEEQALGSRYGEIGISAVAAALNFKCESKNPAYAPVAPEMDEERIAEMAA